MSQPVVEGSLGSPPFEKPNIEQVNMKLKPSACHVLMFSSSRKSNRIIMSLSEDWYASHVFLVPSCLGMH